MTEETKKLFGAPWKKSFQDWESYKEITIYDSKKQPVCLTRNKGMSNRLARLPELYDGLMEALEIICGIPGEDACDHCSNASIDLGGPCRIREWRELLRKVRNGE